MKSPEKNEASLRLEIKKLDNSLENGTSKKPSHEPPESLEQMSLEASEESLEKHELAPPAPVNPTQDTNDDA